MIVGIGSDLCDLRRLAATVARRGDRFAERVLGAAELEVYAARRARSAERGLAFLGTRFAAKEAFSKAIGLGMRTPMTWRGCETLNLPSGAPVIRLHGELAAWFAARGWRAHVTVTDEREVVAAFVVVEAEASPSMQPATHRSSLGG